MDAADALTLGLPRVGSSDDDAWCTDGTLRTDSENCVEMRSCSLKVPSDTVRYSGLHGHRHQH
jgi:hypothetical protein